jgi:hypothetical protein
VVDWTLPGHADQQGFMEFQQSPESLALYYKVPLWSDRHWELIDRTFRFLGRVGNKVLHVPLICKTGFGHEHSMVRWKPKSGGGYEHDFGILERYLDTAVRHQGKPWVIDFIVYDVRFGRKDHVDHENPYKLAANEARRTGGGWFKTAEVTTIDPGTGDAAPMACPSYMDEKALVAFWKPLVVELDKRLETKGLADAAQLGHCNDLFPPPSVIKAWETLWPGKRWTAHSHSRGGGYIGFGSAIRAYRRPYLRSQVTGKKIRLPMLFGWMQPREKLIRAHFARHLRDDKNFLAFHRIRQELAVAAGAHGRSALGADYFPCLKDKKGRTKILFGRYPETNWTWVGHEGSYLAPGPDGAISTTTFELIREGTQECEAKIFIEKALFDEKAKSKLGGALTEKCWKILDTRRELQHTLYGIDGPMWETSSRWGHDVYFDFGWQERSEELYAAAAEVKKTLAAQ